MVLANLPLVGYLVNDLCAKATHLSRDDMASVGALALITAADSFDSSRGVQFGAYARRRILGAFADEMRANDWATRGARKRITETRAIQETLTASLGREPTTEEIAQAMGLSLAETRAILSDAQRSVVAIDDAMNDYLVSSSTTPEESVLEAERTTVVQRAVAALPENLRIIIQRVYFDGATVKDVANELGVTHSAVSQRRTAAMKLLAEGLQKNYVPEQPEVVLSGQTRAAEKRRSAYLQDLTDSLDRTGRKSSGSTTATF